MFDYDEIFMEGYLDALDEMGYLNEGKKTNTGKRRNNRVTVDFKGRKRTMHLKPTARKAITATTPTPARRATGNENVHCKAENVTYKAKKGDIILKDKKGNSYVPGNSSVDKNYQGGSKVVPNDGSEVIIQKKKQSKKAYIPANGTTALYAPWGKAQVSKNHVFVSHGDKNGNNDVSPVERGAGNYDYLPKKLKEAFNMGYNEALEEFNYFD